MRQADFVTELRRLFAASRCEPDLTPQRIDVWWETYQHEPLTRWRRAVSISIGESTARPSQSRMEKALQQAEDEEQQAKIAQDRGGGLSSAFQAATKSTATTTEFRRAVARTMEGAFTGHKPAECADWLEQDAMFDPATDFSHWIEALRSSPGDWRGVPKSARDGGGLVRDRPVDALAARWRPPGRQDEYVVGMDPAMPQADDYGGPPLEGEA